MNTNAPTTGPVVSDFDIAVFGTLGDTFTSYRRLFLNGDDVVAMPPDGPAREDQFYGVYKWDDEKSMWLHMTDIDDEQEARVHAITLAGSDVLYRP